MQFYRVICEEDTVYADPLFGFRGTYAEAQQLARTVPKTFWGKTFVDLIDIPTDKEAICKYLNSDIDAVRGAKALRSWSLSARGAMQEFKE